uniref:DNA-directed RNA polymerases I and III subunit RPAC2 n=1 Tax=Noccaea caerulescens TaxID=107243 RepID=A0A1J3G9M4_NOCCA
MEHGSFTNNSHASFTLAEEDHTLANAVRFMLNQDPRVTLAGYSIPHPSLDRVNIRVQTTGDPAREVLKDACQELMLMNRHVRSVFDKAVAEFKVEEARKKAEEDELQKQRDHLESMDIEGN